MKTAVKTASANGKLNSSPVKVNAIQPFGNVETAGSPQGKNAETETKNIQTPAPVQAIEQVKPEAEQTAPQAPETTVEHSKTAPTKMEIKDQFKEFKPSMNLEQVLKWVETMHRRKTHRDKLVETISSLDAFEVAQMDDAEETGTNHFQGCELTIEDDNRKQFSTKNPFIIKAVAEYVKTLCVDKLAEIEGEIIIPT